MKNPIIEIYNLNFEYPSHQALNGIDLVIEEGSVTALVGPNGAGKTTLMRCIAALESPTSGRVLVAGLDVHEQPRQAHRLMGYLSDNFGLYIDLTVEQSLIYAACSQGLSALDVPKAIHLTAQRLGLVDKLQHSVGQLSRGQRQRLAIGQAIIHAPRVLLLDEPANGLDPEARSSLAQLFNDLQSQGISLLVSSHILVELDAYSTHMLAIHNGQILEHRALRSGQHNVQPERLLRLAFAQGKLSQASAWLALQPHVKEHHINTREEVVEILFDGNAVQQANLVAACVAAGHPLMVITPVSENLQQSYLRSLQNARSNLLSDKSISRQGQGVNDES